LKVINLRDNLIRNEGAQGIYDALKEGKNNVVEKIILDLNPIKQSIIENIEEWT
jgi:hypothetical protein